MNNSENKLSIVPPSIELLFNNEKLDLIKLLCLLHAFSLKSSRKIRVSELLFYYGLVNFNLLRLFDENNYDSSTLAEPSINLYFRFQTKIPKIILDLSNLQFIVLNGDLSKKIDEITLKITPNGQNIIEELDSHFFKELINNYSTVIDSIKFTSNNLKIITEGE